MKIYGKQSFIHRKNALLILFTDQKAAAYCKLAAFSNNISSICHIAAVHCGQKNK